MTDPRIEAAARALFGDKVDAPSGARDYLFEEVRKALAAADAAAWRPVETAPRDGTHVDLWVINCDGKGHRCTDAYFGLIPHTCGEYGRYCDSCPPEGNFWVDGIFGEQISGEIIGWQHLPAPLEGEPQGNRIAELEGGKDG